MSYYRTVQKIYNATIRNKREEPRFLMLTSFILTFLITRIIAYSASGIIQFPFFHDVYIHQIHIHHLVFGIFLLLLSGLIGIPQLDASFSRLSSILYGMGAALTLDEFALWLHLDPSRYFGPQGRISIDVVFLFSLILCAHLFYGSFWKKIILLTLKLFGYKREKKEKNVYNDTNIN